MKKPAIIVRNSLSNQALGVLKARLLSGDIPPGTQLIVDVLASDLKISRTPVREALITLISIGLVSYDGNSYLAASYTARDVEELFVIRRTLEALAIREACLRLAEEPVSHFGNLCRRAAEQSSKKGESANAMIKLDAAFHKLIYEGCQNRRLENILTDIQDKLGLIYRWGNLTKKLKYAETATIDEYLDFIGCFKRRDVRKATRLIDKHLVDGEQFVLWCLGFSPEADGPAGSAANKD
jgi:DNA-binding GntR family transcriptional regulator